MNIWCWLFGHKKLMLHATGDALISVSDGLGSLYRVHPCIRCHVLFVEIG